MSAVVGKRPLAGRVLTWLVVALLTVVAVTGVVIAVEVQRLVVEQQRTTCYERMAWLFPGEEELPGGVERSRAARMCEGDTPIIEFQD